MVWNYGKHPVWIGKRCRKVLCCSAGLWSQIKRAPKAKKVQKTFETPGPKQPNGMALDKRAQQIFAYFKKYNYEVKDAGNVIRFAGNYKASRGQAAALTFYVFMGEFIAHALRWLLHHLWFPRSI